MTGKIGMIVLYSTTEWAWRKITHSVRSLKARLTEDACGAVDTPGNHEVGALERMTRVDYFTGLGLPRSVTHCILFGRNTVTVI